MGKFSFIACPSLAKTSAIFLFISFLVSFNTIAQNRTFGFVYSENMKGGTALFGNTLMNAVKPNPIVDLTAMNGNSVNGYSIYDNGTSDMQYADIDGNSGAGAGTRNSSSADLNLPAGTNTIKLARLYWGGRAATADFDMNLAANRKIKIRKGTSGGYQEYSAVQIDRIYKNAGTATEFCRYQAYTDITTLVQLQGAGTYTVGNGAFSTGIIDAFGNYGAWSIVIVYENPALNFNSVRVYDGFEEVYSGGSVTQNTVTLTGLNVPSGALATADARLGLMGWEGDSRYTGDFFKINGVLFSNALNPSNNPWNGTITSNGAHVTTKNPNYTDQFGIDIDEAEVGTGYGILPDAQSIKLELGTTDDQFFCGVITFVVKMKDPVMKLTKTVTDANSSNTAEPGEILTYKLKGKNIRTANAKSLVLIDSLPPTITFVSNSLIVNYCPGITAGAKTDAPNDDIAQYDATTNTVTFWLGFGADAVSGGFLAPNDSFEVQFQAIVNNPVSGSVAPSIVNVGRLSSIASLVFYVDDATAMINPPIVVPVSLTSFTADLLQSNQVKVAWNTSMELNSKLFIVERSSDGNSFKMVATKAAAGNSSTAISYFINDDISAVTAPIVYYRLKQTDINGKSDVSKIVSVRLKKATGNFSVSPNPFRNAFNINIDWDKNETTVVKIFNVAGTEVVSKSITMKKGLNYITLDKLSAVPSGNYIIEFTTPTGKLTKQIIKQK